MSTQGFWAIDDIRECNVQESRTITMNSTNKESVFCQTLNFPNWKLSSKGSITDNPDTFFCKDKMYIGANCDIPCKSVDPNNDMYCNRHRICKPSSKSSETRCACALGYKGARCNKPCTPGTYGYYCQHKCGYCINNEYCLKSSGKCDNSCENGYEEPLCTIPLYPILKKPPTFVNSTLTYITVRLDNIDTEGKRKAVKFQLQYTINTMGPWINYREPLTLKESAVVTVENLIAETNYLIRAILFTINENSYTGIRVPNVTAFTNCTGVSENQMKLQTLPLHLLHKKKFVLKKIKTGASVPPAVRDLTVYSRDEGYLVLRWKPPFPSYGELESYDLTYKNCNLEKGDSLVITEPTLCKLWDGFVCHRLINVEGNQCYKVHIRAKNKNVTNYSDHICQETYTVQKPSQAPRNLTATWNNQDELTLNWTHPLVTNGDLSSFVILFDSTERNKYKFSETYPVHDEKRFYIYKIQKSIHLSTKYNLSIYGKNKYVGESTSITVVTPPATPALVGKVTAGKRTNTTQVITIPSIDITITGSRDVYIYVVVCDPKQQSSNISAINPPSCRENITKQTNCSGTAWVAGKLPVNTAGISFTVGDNATARNKPLQPNISYQVSVVLLNYYNDICRYKVYTLTTLTPIFKPEEHSHPALYALLLLLIVPVIIWFIYRGKIKSKRGSIANDQQNFILSQLITAPKEDRTIKDSGTITQPLLQNIVNGENKEYSRIVPIGSLADYVKISMENGELKNQQQLFPKGQTKPWDYGMLTENKNKNRYANLSAYDETRVVLDKIQDNPYSDFINANYIDGYQQTKAYIATQGPKVTTVNDFWRMIWQKNVSCIVMLANIVESNKKKCEQYWPEKGNSRTFLNILVSFHSSEIYADYEYRTFVAQCGEETRQIQQLHFTSWPDHGVPLYPQTLVPFVKKLLTFSTKTQPIVVHCSAGVGRTGTIILCDICLRMAAKEKAIDVLYYLKKIRDQRANMVDNVSQYNLVHMVLLECLTAPDTNISCQNLPAEVDQWITQKEIQKQMAYLQNTAWYYRMMAGKITDGKIKANTSKNRFTHIIPETKRIYLTRYPVQEEHSDYINAVPVDGFRFKEQFIATQTPLPHTVGDFWRMVDEQNVGVILSLNDIDINDKTSCAFWPCQLGVMNPVPYLNVKYISVIRETLYDKYTVQMENKNPKDSENGQYVTIIQFKGWNREEIVPSNVNILLSLLSETETYFRRNTPVVVSCYDGYTASGLFLALAFTIEKIKLEKTVDVCMAVREIRKNRVQFVNYECQFQFLYQAAVAYVHSFEIYSNFQ
ncbi:Leukocyte-antigen-related-like [Carabus blaptoides fortunei]